MTRMIHRGDDEKAVTSILGAILVAGLLVGVLVTIRVQFVPVWEENGEAAHMLQVENELSVLRAQMDRQASNTSTANVANHLTLGQSRSSMFAQRPLPPSVTFTPGSTATTIQADEITIFIQNGVAIPLADNEWITIEDTTDEINSIEGALALRLRISNPQTEDHGDEVSIVVTQGDGSPGGRFTVERLSDPPDYMIRHTTISATGEEITAVLDPYFQQTSLAPYYYVNALEDQFVFDQVLAAATPPFTLSLDNDGFSDASYSIVYFEGDGSGSSILIGKGGRTIEDYNQPFPGGILRYEANNNYYSTQTFVIENGAIILDQPEGQAFKVPPGFFVTQVGTTTGISITLPSLVGVEKGFTGNMVSIVNTQRGSGTSYHAVTEAFNYTVSTEYPHLWDRFWTDRMVAAGLTEGVEFEVSTTASSAMLQVNGAVVDPDTKDISIQLVQADIRVRLEV